MISYYKEDLDWVHEYANLPFRRIYIYNKGPGTPTIDLPHIEIPLPNIGRCDHTYLYHIVEKYHTLAPVTIFTTGSASLPHKKEQLQFTVSKVVETRTSVFQGHHHNDVGNELYEFRLHAWRSTHENNKETGTSQDALYPSSIQPFGKWYTTTFPGVTANFVSYLGVFAISREHVYQHTLDYYQRLLDQFPNHSNPEVGHYFERSWVAVFSPIPDSCLYEKEPQPPSQLYFYLFVALCVLLSFYILTHSMRLDRFVYRACASMGLLPYWKGKGK